MTEASFADALLSDASARQITVSGSTSDSIHVDEQ